MVRKFLIFILTSVFCVAVSAAPANFSYQGQIVKPNGQPLEGSNVTFYIEILSPAPSECVLYEEYHTLNMTGSNGIFAFEVGDGTQSGSDYEDVNSLTDALSNSIGTISPTTCVVGPNYTPSAGDGRQMRVTFDDGSGPNTLATNHQILSVPYADSASSVDGLTSADILRINNGGSFVLTQANLEWIFANGARYAELQALIDGTSTQYLTATPTGDVSMNSQKIINVADPTAANDAANKNYVDTNIAGQPTDAATLSGLAGAENGHVMYWNGTEWTAGAPAGDSTKLPLAGGTMSGAINMGNQDITNGNNITANGAVSANGLSTGTNLAFYNTGNYVGFQAPAGASDLIWTLPGADGTANQALSTNGSGILSWRSYVETASNQGAGGVGPYKQLNAGDLEFKNINAGSNKVTVTDDVGNDEIDIDVDESNFNPALIPNTAAGDIAAGNVQAAINELDTEKVAIAGDAMTGALTMNAQSEVRFADSDSSNYVGFAAPAAVGADLIWTLPNADGTNGQILSTDGAGNLVWVSGAVGDITGGSSLGAGVSVYKNENAGVLEFASINAGSNKVTITDDAGVEIDIDVDETNFDPTAIPNNAAGNIAATTLQGAINELDTEKLSDVTGSALADGTVWVGDGSNQAQEVSVTGDVAMSNTGATTIQANAVESSMILDGEIVDADISATAAIARTKMANGAANRLIVNDGTGEISEAAAISASRALTSDVNGIPVASSVTSTELGYLSGVTSSLQTQLDGKVALAGDTMSGQLLIDGGADEVQLAVEGDTLQTANLVEIRNSASTVIASVSADGTVSAATDLTTKSYVDTAISGINTDEIADADNNTKIQVEEGANDDTIRFDTAGSERMVISPTGSVGIGTTSPDALTMLDVNGISKSTEVVAPVLRGSTANTFSEVRLSPSGSSVQLHFGNRWVAFAGTNISATGGGQDIGITLGQSGEGVSFGSGNANIRYGGEVGALSQRNGVQAQEYRIYNTFDGSNDEFVSMGFKNNANTFTFDSEAIGTGTVRDFTFMNGNVGIGTGNPATKLDVEGTIQIGDGGETCSIAANAGMIRYNSGNLDYCNGSAWTTLGISGAGLTNLNGQTGSSQTFAVDATGTAPAINSATDTHTLSIPLASGAGVTSGTLSKTDYDAFSAKLDSVVGETLNSAQFWVGDATNAAAAVTMSGDATMDNAGALTIANDAITSAKINDGTIVDADISATADIARSKLAAGTANRLIVNDGTGEVSEAAAITASRALTSDANGIPVASSVTDTELGYLSGVASALQTQLDGKVAVAGDTMTGQLLIDGGADEVQLAVEGDLLQTANLVEIRNSTSTVVASVSADGSVSATTDLTTKAYVDSAVSGISTDEIADADNNTKIQVEEGANDDTIRFDTAGTERMVISPTGSVGIGTTSPIQTLSIFAESGSGLMALSTQSDNLGNNLNDSQSIARFYSGNGPSGTNPTGLLIENTRTATNGSDTWHNQTMSLSHQTASTSFSSINFGVNANTDGGYVSIRGRDNEALRVVGTSGNVGIGTANPIWNLQIDEEGGSDGSSVALNSTGNNASGVRLFRSNGTNSSPLNVNGGDVLGVLAVGGFWTGKTNSRFENGDGRSQIRVLATENWSSSTQNGTAMTFTTTANGTSTQVERLRIDQSGNIGIGTQTPNTLLDVEGTVQIGDGGETCTVAANAGMIRYNSGNIDYCNGSAWTTLGVSGAGLTNLNGQTGSTQNFAVDAAGTAPAINSATDTHTLSIPLASGAGVTSGTISKSDYDAFSAKLDSVVGETLNSAQFWVGDATNAAAAVTMSGDATMDNAGAVTIANDAITSAKINDGTIVDADISATADIARSKLAAGTANRLIVNDGTGEISEAPAITANRVLASDASGIPVASGTTDTELGYLSGVTSAIQTQLDGKVDVAGDTMTGPLALPSENDPANPELTFAGDTDTGIYSPAADRLAFATAGLARMTIRNNGWIGIGTTSPVTQLNLSGNGDQSFIIDTFGAGSSTIPRFGGRRARGSQGSPATANNNDGLLFIGGQGYDGSAYSGYSGGISIRAAENFSASNHGSYMAFETTPNGSTAASRTENMRITSTGDVGIGTSSPATKLDVEGTIQIGDGGETCTLAANAGMIRYNAGNIDYCNGSAWTTLGVSGAGLTNLNGQTGSTQNFAVDAAGTAPAINSATDTHTLSIPLASGAGVTSGTISKSDYDAFSAKLDSVVGETLNSAQFWVGDATNAAAAVTMSGDATMDNAGAVTIANDAITSAKINDGTIVDADISVTADIARSKLAAGTANRLIVNDGTGEISEAAVITASRALASDANGIPVASSATDTELGYLSGVTSALQTQLDGKVALAGDTMTGQLLIDGGADEVQLAIEGDLLQTANLVELRNSSSVVVASVSADGSVSAATDLTTKAYVDSAVSGISSDEIADADNNTKIQVEEGANDDTIRFDTAGTERMVIDSSGNVGIGTNSPSNPLQVNGTIVATDFRVNNDYPRMAYWGGNANLPGVEFDANDGYRYSQSSDQFQLLVGGSPLYEFNDSGGLTINRWDATPTNNPRLVLMRARGTSASPTYLLSNDEIGAVEFKNHNSGKAAQISSIATENHSATAAGAKLSFETTPNTTTTPISRMTIDQNGQVGIGTSAPSNLLSLFADGGDANIDLEAYENGMYSNFINFKKYRGTSASPAIVGSSDRLGLLQFQGYDGSTLRTPVSIEVRMDGTPGAADMPSRIDIHTTPDGSSTPVERLTIRNTGFVGIGSTSPRSRLEVNGDIQIGNSSVACDGTKVGALRYNTGSVEFCNGTSWAALSSGGVSAINDLTDGATTADNLLLGGASLGTGQFNTGVGIDALSIGSGDGNTALGYDALRTTGSGHSNTAVGANAMDGGNGITNNTAVGRNALGDGTTYTGNTAIGRDALATGDSNDDNVAVGYGSGNGTGGDNDQNVILGYNAGGSINNADNNVLIGYQAGDSITSGNNNIIIGHDVDILGVGTSSNELNIGNAITGDLTTGDVSVDNELRLTDADDSNYVGFVAPAIVGSDVVWTLPDADGTSGQVLQTNGSGVLSWTNASGGGDLLNGGNTGAVVVGSDDNTLTLESNNVTALSFDTSQDATFAGTVYTDLLRDPTLSRYLGFNTNGVVRLFSGDTDIEIKTNNVDDILFTTSNNERARITASGNVGIGTSVPAQRLEVADGDAVVTDYGSTAGMELRKANGTMASPSAILNGEGIGRVEFSGYGATNWITNSAAKIEIRAAETWTDATGAANMRFYTRPSGSIGASLERMRITDDGNIGIGTTSPAVELDVNTGTINAASICDENNANCLDLSSGAGSGNFLADGSIPMTGPFQANVGSVAAPGITLEGDEDTGFFSDAQGVLKYSSNGVAHYSINDLDIRSTNVSGFLLKQTGSTVAAPSYSWAADTDSGFYRSNANEIGLSTGGISRLMIDSSGNVGIGTTNPSHLLTVENSGSNPIAAIRSDNSDIMASEYVLKRKRADAVAPGAGFGALINFQFEGATNDLMTNAGQIGVVWENAQSNDTTDRDSAMVFLTTLNDNLNEKMRIASNGNVGIGTTTPADKFHVHNTGDSRLYLTTNSNLGSNNSSIWFASDYDGTPNGAAIGMRGDGGLRFTGGTDLVNPDMIISDTGDVGIGTTTPDDKLVVDGTIRNLAAIDQSSNTTIDFSSGNIQYTTDDCQAFNLHNMKSGGSYTFVVQGTTSATCSFTAYSDAGSTSLTVHMPADHGATTASTHTIYTAIVAGTHIYFAWMPDL